MGSSFPKIIPRRALESHKGDYGHVFVIAGSVGMTGAAFLCSQAALRAGSGLVTLGIPKGLNPILEVKLTEVMTLPLPQAQEGSLALGAFSEILEFSKLCDSVAIGPGLSRNKQTQQLVRKLLLSLERPVCLDADGANALVGHLSILRKVEIPLVLSPHPGEMARLLGIEARDVQRGRRKIAQEFAKAKEVVVVLKGHRSVVADPEGKLYINETGNPGMATAGSGDILAGMIASFLGQGIEPFRAAKLAVYLHGAAGDLAAEEKGQISLMAGDILAKLPQVMKNL